MIGSTTSSAVQQVFLETQELSFLWQVLCQVALEWNAGRGLELALTLQAPNVIDVRGSTSGTPGQG